MKKSLLCGMAGVAMLAVSVWAQVPPAPINFHVEYPSQLPIWVSADLVWNTNPSNPPGYTVYDYFIETRDHSLNNGWVRNDAFPYSIFEGGTEFRAPVWLPEDPTITNTWVIDYRVRALLFESASFGPLITSAPSDIVTFGVPLSNDTATIDLAYELPAIKLPANDLQSPPFDYVFERNANEFPAPWSFTYVDRQRSTALMSGTNVWVDYSYDTQNRPSTYYHYRKVGRNFVSAASRNLDVNQRPFLIQTDVDLTDWGLEFRNWMPWEEPNEGIIISRRLEDTNYWEIIYRQMGMVPSDYPFWVDDSISIESSLPAFYRMRSWNDRSISKCVDIFVNDRACSVPVPTVQMPAGQQGVAELSWMLPPHPGTIWSFHIERKVDGSSWWSFGYPYNVLSEESGWTRPIFDLLEMPGLYSYRLREKSLAGTNYFISLPSASAFIDYASQIDSDSDGLLDAEELNIYFTDPYNFDTDSDGMGDGWEILEHLNPLSPDTDYDGMPDLWETAYGTDPRSNDAASDLDGDGFSNLNEYQNGTDPRDPLSHPPSGDLPLEPISLQIEYYDAGSVAWLQLSWIHNEENGWSYIIESKDRFNDWHDSGLFAMPQIMPYGLRWMAMLSPLSEDTASWPIEYRVRAVKEGGRMTEPSETVVYGVPLSDTSIEASLWDERPTLQLPFMDGGAPMNNIVEKRELGDSRWIPMFTPVNQWTDVSYDTQSMTPTEYRYRQTGPGFVSAPTEICSFNVESFTAWMNVNLTEMGLAIQLPNELAPYHGLMISRLDGIDQSWAVVLNYPPTIDLQVPEWTDCDFDLNSTEPRVYRVRQYTYNSFSVPQIITVNEQPFSSALSVQQTDGANVRLSCLALPTFADYFIERRTSSNDWSIVRQSHAYDPMQTHVEEHDWIIDLTGEVAYRIRAAYRNAGGIVVTRVSDPVSIIINPDMDVDNDGLKDRAEYIYGTLLDIPDTDYDGMPDGWEVSYQLNPLVDDATADADGDGMSNLAEYQGGFNPRDPLSPAPVTNLARSSRGTRLNAFNALKAIDGNTSISGYAHCSVGKSMTMDLREACSITQMDIYLWNGDARTYGYRIEASLDGLNWTNVVPARTGKGKQTLPFTAPVQARYLRLNALTNTVNSGFHVAEWEVYGRVMAQPPSSMTNLALATRGTFLQAVQFRQAIDGVTSGYNGSSGYAYCLVGESMVMDLKTNCSIHQLNLLLWDGDNRQYGYRIEASQDARNWVEIIPAQTHYSWQFLSLASPVQARYLRLHALTNTANSGFHLVEWEVIGQPTHGPAPLPNLALSSSGTTLQAVNGLKAIDGITTGYNGSSGYAYCLVGEAMIMDLKSVRTVDQTRLLLWDGDSRTYTYRIQTSTDGVTWTDVAPTRSSKSWQFLSLAQPTPARYLKLLALANTANNGFHVVEWEVYGH
jgi:hypothetical protein